MCFYCVFQSLQQHFFANLRQGFITAFAELALGTGGVHGGKAVLVVDVFIRHILWLMVNSACVVFTSLI